jgi:hypothetical protein
LAIQLLPASEMITEDAEMNSLQRGMFTAGLDL